MNRTILLVGLGGFLGSIARFLLAAPLNKNFPGSFPYGTFTVNITGCLLIGIFYGLSVRYDWFNPDLRIFVTAGFCAGFTTFSSLIYESVILLQSAQYLTFILYNAGSFVAGLVATLAGVYITK